MSIYVTGYTEARINGKWHCIDFFQRDLKGELRIVPCIEGASMVRHALEWDCNVQRLMVLPSDISDDVRKECTSRTGSLLGSDPQNDGYWWSSIEGKWFAKAILTIPEYCGFFPRQALGYYLCNPDDNSLDTDRMLSVEEYHKLDAEEKKAYQYYEYTDSESERLILYNFKEAVVQRLKAINERLFWSSEIDSELFFSDVRVLLLEG